VSRGRREDPFAEFYGELRDRLRGDRWQPDVDVFETEKSLVVRVELAGVRGEAEPADVKRLHQMEIASGPFERRLRLPMGFDRENVTAHLADGFLTVTLPKRTPVRLRVEGGSTGDE
jgi:HSP20 family protein